MEGGKKVPSPFSYKNFKVKIGNQAPKNLLVYKLKIPSILYSGCFSKFTHCSTTNHTPVVCEYNGMESIHVFESQFH